jgi:hypothetical protein
MYGELLDEIDATANILYQNKVQEGMKNVAKLLSVLGDLINHHTEEQNTEVGQFAVMMLKELLEAYQNSDVIGMADCLKEKSALYAQYIEG